MSTTSQPIGVIARLLDLSERRVQQLSREGLIPKAERGQYDLIGSVRGYVRYLRDQAQKAQAGAPDYASERARFIRARADLAEMEAEEKRHALIAADQIEAAWIAVLALLRTRLLALPDRLAPQAFEKSTVGDTRNLIRAAIREVLDDLAEPDIEIETDSEIDGLADREADGGENTRGSETTAGLDDQRLGGSEPAAEL
ncbi:terminase small subunit, Nu1 [Salibaculum griseiflavum]|uniref:Terminase small subunit, Nu1 n=1 Tax=Salibaculum griseiflavum TaxID=1914409 RepID=A0A2V1P0W7_9RHOB|nr:terminase small subunit, Nu1 [Salibaculum griseiflavum]PWG16095.1 terminase small subunit, Nu1 [Salibaculum griseiflavum]